MPLAVLSKEPRTLDVPSKVSGDRLQIPGAKSAGDRSQKGRPLHFPGVQALGHWSHQEAEWLQSSEEGLSGEPLDSHNIVVDQPVFEPTDKHLMK